VPRARTIILDPLPLTQSAELQTRRPEATTTDTNPVPILKRHGCCWEEKACTVKLGILPAWYQYCGDERRSVTAPGAQAGACPEAGAGACPEAGERLVPGCGEGTGRSRGVAEDAGSARLPLTCAAAGPAAPVPSADERPVSIPFTVQLRAVSNPMPAAKTNTRRRQYVVGEIPAGRVRAPRGESAPSRGFWPIFVKYARQPWIWPKARRPGALLSPPEGRRSRR
jgi:hypothetical protein